MDIKVTVYDDNPASIPQGFYLYRKHEQTILWPGSDSHKAVEQWLIQHQEGWEALPFWLPAQTGGLFFSGVNYSINLNYGATIVSYKDKNNKIHSVRKYLNLEDNALLLEIVK